MVPIIGVVAGHDPVQHRLEVGRDSHVVFEFSEGACPASQPQIGGPRLWRASPHSASSRTPPTAHPPSDSVDSILTGRRSGCIGDWRGKGCLALEQRHLYGLARVRVLQRREVGHLVVVEVADGPELKPRILGGRPSGSDLAHLARL